MLGWFVYVLQGPSTRFTYIGSTNNLQRRLAEHSKGLVQSTKAYRPLRVVAYVAVPTERQARNLEHYFKTGSGKAILRKRILTDEAVSQA